MAESLSDRAARFAARARGMLPKGRAWARHTGAELLDVLTATTYELARVEARSDEFRTEMDPEQTSALLGEWESALGLPGECTAPSTTEGRRAAIIARLTDSGTNTEQALRDAVNNFDSLTSIASIDTPTQFEVGTDGGGAGQPVGADEWAHTKVIQLVSANGSLDTTALECILDGLKRAHGHYIYEYETVTDEMRVTTGGDIRLTLTGDPRTVTAANSLIAEGGDTLTTESGLELALE